MAPTGSAHLDGYQNRQGIKVLDYSSRELNVKTWTLVYGDGSDQKMLILELPDEVVQDMRRYSPRRFICSNPSQACFVRLLLFCTVQRTISWKTLPCGRCPGLL